MTTTTNRRDFLALLSMLPAAGLARTGFAQGGPITRPLGPKGERVPVIGLGSSKLVEESATHGEDPLRQVLRAFASGGGRVVDSWPRNADNDARFGRVINEPELQDRLFIAAKIDQVGREAGVAQFREVQRRYGRKTIDLMQVFSLTDVNTHWPSLRAWKDAGEARYIGVTVSEPRLHDQLEQFLRREQPDVVQMNYSVTERQVEARLLPLAAERGVAVFINRPFMNGAYFKRLEGTPLPDWTAAFGTRSWAQFSLKYILANPAVTCVLTETSNPKHVVENLDAAVGTLPDEAARQRMRQFIDAL